MGVICSASWKPWGVQVGKVNLVKEWAHIVTSSSFSRESQNPTEFSILAAKSNKKEKPNSLESQTKRVCGRIPRLPICNLWNEGFWEGGIGERCQKGWGMRTEKRGVGSKEVIGCCSWVLKSQLKLETWSLSWCHTQSYDFPWQHLTFWEELAEKELAAGCNRAESEKRDTGQRVNWSDMYG